MTQQELYELEDLKEAYHSALRIFRAHPSLGTKADMNKAQRIYQRRRMQLDPEFAEARAESGRRWREKKALGIPTGPSANPKYKPDPLDEEWIEK